MKRSLLLIAAVSMFFSPASGQPGASSSRVVMVLNPAVSDKLADRIPLAPRLNTLEGKTIYLVDTNYEGMGRTPVLEEMQAWFASNMPRTKVVFKLKSGNYAADDPGLWKEIAANKGDAVIIGVAG